MTEDSKKEPKLSEQITDAAVKLLVAGSGGSSLYFLFTDSIPKALIAGAIATGAGLLSNFWEGFSGVLKPRFKTLGEQGGKVIDKRLTDFSSQFKFPRIVSRITKNLLLWVRNRGLSRPSMVSIKRCFCSS